MSRLTSDLDWIETSFICNLREQYPKYVDNFENMRKKLNIANDIEEELGCPLEVVFKALEILRNSNKQFGQTSIGTNYGLAVYFDINNQEEFDFLKKVLENE